MMFPPTNKKSLKGINTLRVCIPSISHFKENEDDEKFDDILEINKETT